MNTNFQIKSLNDKEFYDYFTLAASELEKIGVIKMIVDTKPGFPCRVSLEDADIGEEVILLSYKHHRTNSPYQSSGPIFIRKNGKPATLSINEIPEMLYIRLLSLRGFNNDGIMKEALIKIFENEEINYIHIHNAIRGCYNCTADRVVNEHIKTSLSGVKFRL